MKTMSRSLLWMDRVLFMIAVPFLVVFVLLGAWSGLVSLYPPTYWYELKGVTLQPTHNGDLLVSLQRIVHRDFTGHRYMTIFDGETMEEVCSGDVDQRYRANSTPPTTVHLSEWFPDAECRGRLERQRPYIMQLCVRIDHTLPMLPGRETCLDQSFTMDPPGEAANEPAGNTSQFAVTRIRSWPN